MSHGNTANPLQAVAGEPSDAARQPSRFTYGSGTRPLDGYTIKRGIGVGGFGEVYYAVSDAGKDVALKRIQRNLDIELRGVRQCLNLKHPHLLALFDIRHDSEGQTWVIMEYVAGTNLQDVIERHPRGASREEVHRWFDGMAAGVEHLHDCGIVHRDLKPGNIFLDQTNTSHGTVKVGDYGLSKFISCSRRSGQTQSVGTFHYMAPEIGQGRYGKEIDIYALGIMLYEMLTGHVPYDGESSQEIIMKHLTARPDLSRVPVAYRHVIDRALAKDPAGRFASVGQMRQAVAACETTGNRKAGPIYGAAATAAQSTAYDMPLPRMGHAVLDEPIGRSVRAGWLMLNRTLNQLPFATPAKILLIVLSTWFVIHNGEWLLPMLGMFGLGYLAYLGVRAVALSAPEPGTPSSKQVHGSRQAPGGGTGSRDHATSDPKAAGYEIPGSIALQNDIIEAHAVGSHKHPVSGTPMRTASAKRCMSRPSNKAAIERYLRQSLRQRHSARHGLELTGAWLMAALVAAVVGIVVFLVPELHGGTGFPSTVEQWLPMYAWMTLSSLAGAWTLLALGKTWEGSKGDAARRRFTQLIAGMLVGAISWGLCEFLMVRPTYLLDNWNSHSSGLHGPDGLPLLPGFMAYFGAVFVLPRWWRHMDPLRRGRMSLWNTMVLVVIAFLVHSVCPFPRGFVIVAAMALSVQLAAPWLAPDERKQLANSSATQTA